MGQSVQPRAVQLESLAQVDTDSTDLLLTRGVGTLLWSAPEVLAGQRYGLSADVYRYDYFLFH